MQPVKVNETAVAVFAKAPIPGYAKTRLIPALGAAGAARLQAALTELTLRTAVEARLGPVSLWCAPDHEHAFFCAMAQAHGVELYMQDGNDLGARMRAAFDVLTPTGPVLLMGTDCVVLSPSDLRDCARVLADGHDTVFLPAEDGGYALIGASKAHPALLDGMPWGTSRVMDETRARAARAGLRLVELRTVWDIDTAEEYRRALFTGLLPQPSGQTDPR